MSGWRVRTSDHGWSVIPPDDSALAALLASGSSAGLGAPTYGRAIRALVAAAPAAPGLLAERWISDEGVAFAEPTGPGRDFSRVVWSWRDPSQSLVPLMLQRVTAEGHDEAELAGYVDALWTNGGTVGATGGFYDSEAGRAFRDLLLDGRRFGVSVDPGEHTDAEWDCTETDADGFCTNGKMVFSTYEIVGITGTPFPGFARASIRLATEAADAVAAGMIADFHRDNAARMLGIPPLIAGATLLRNRPPAEWFRMPEPEPGPGSPMVAQDDSGWGVPLTILDSGQWFGHVARWGQCHTGYPDECVQAPPSRTGYAGFHLGLTVCADGTEIPTGTMTVGCDHAPLRMRAPGAREHYDHSGLSWGTARMTDGYYGIWACGALRPDVDGALVDLLRTLSLSGDWRRDRTINHLEMLAVLAVNVPGFPQRREAARIGTDYHRADALAASLPTISTPGAYWHDDELEALTSSGVVRRECESCRESRTRDDLVARIDRQDEQIRALTRLFVRPVG